MASSTLSRPSIADTFAALRAKKQIAFMPFIPAGYPDLETTAKLLPAIELAGANLVEVGIPFSDPIADGPVIQEAFTRALERKVKLAEIFATIRSVRASVSIPLVAMVSVSIAYRYGLERFAATLKESGFDALLLPDLPPPEAEGVVEKVRSAGLDSVLLVAPSTSIERRKEIARLSSGFIYYLSVAGITGERNELPAGLGEGVTQMKGLTDRPVCVGFGISTPQHMKQLSGVADGAIVGSAIVRRMTAGAGRGVEGIVEDVEAYCRELLSQVR